MGDGSLAYDKNLLIFQKHSVKFIALRENTRRSLIR